ncbi:Putative E3 ubiquitin-protein ligase XBAT31 [Morus notabilis]|uniref:RING-type E3 ubiquitin transferase n=1 Tax=Morus notabilis TaxID=981085 RepID=W9SIK3_9ROSA|nr:putative E3 ubiquitin-protein ligase XBAT31 [Morus notabilis]EXC31004.1 Putative E3 ubiquitin-protein ligase XBAT31 [Morus notabilis]
MGQGLSCGGDRHERALLRALRDGDVDDVTELTQTQTQTQSFQTLSFGRGKLSALHVAAANGRIELLSMLLDRFGNPDVLNRHKQTPLMLAAMHGNGACVQKLLEAGANILMFDSVNGRTCLHYASYYGHSDCLQVILSAARSSPVANSWGFARFVNIRDGGGATPLHLAARQRRPECVHVLLDHGALACASTGGYSYPGSTPLHLAARGGSLECVRELLAWGADRLQLDSNGRIPYTVAMRHKNCACAALLNLSAAELLVWPSPLKFISELNPEAKALLERALMEANMEREKAILKETVYSAPSPINSDVEADDNASEASEVELCCICFDQMCTIEVRPCGHQMCAHCILALCCHKKPNSRSTCPTSPLCPFCRSNISQLVVANANTNNDMETAETSASKPWKSRKSNFSEGSSSFKSLSAVGSFSRMGGRNSGKVAAECSEDVDKP